MKKLFPMLFALTLIMPVAAYAKGKSEAVNLKTMTCKEMTELMQEDADAGTAMIFWLDGYLAGLTQDTTFDPGALEAFVESLSKLCAKKPKTKVLEAAKEVGIDQGDDEAETDDGAEAE